LADSLEISFEPSRRTLLTIDDSVHIQDNLVLRAARSVLDETKSTGTVHFRLTKKIPMGGGLGGGSSNAAAVLLALPVLIRKAISFDRVSELGTNLGSDVPFFLTGGTSLGIGRGTELYDLPDIASSPILLYCPQVHVSTKDAYGGMAERGLTDADFSSRINSFRAYVRELAGKRSAVLAGSLSRNDFEEVVFRRYPHLKTVAGSVRRSGAASWRMSGSGSTIFGLFESRAAREVAQQRWASGRRSQECPVVSAELVSRKQYQGLWRRQLGKFLGSEASIWPPQSL
jgi:4-diphosphocytidyl-2-C-methyl-D-erythritol kinase